MMSKIQILRSLSHTVTRHLPTSPSKSRVFISFQFSSSSASNSTSISSPLFNYLTVDLNLPMEKALYISTGRRFSSVTLLDKPKAVVRYLRSLGLTDSEIVSAVQAFPQLLFSNIGKSLEPKIKLFQDMGVVGPHLGPFLAKSSTILASSISKCLVPNLQLLIKILGDNPDQPKCLPSVINRYNRIAKMRNSKLLKNIEFLHSCGVVGSQLSMLLQRQPRVLSYRESRLRDLVSDVLEMGFSTDSKMFVYGVMCISSLSKATLRRKMDLFAGIGISKNSCLDILKSRPLLFMASEEKIAKGMDFFLNTAKFDVKDLVARPALLMYSLEGRVTPRYRVFQVLKAKKLLKKEPSFASVLVLTEEKFINRFLPKFEQKDELWKVYTSHHLDKDSSSESS